MKTLNIVTTSKRKFDEISLALSSCFDCVQKDIHIVEVQGTSEEIILDKVKQAYKAVNGLVLVDDVSVHFDLLGGFPGPYMKDFTNCMSSTEMADLFLGTKGKGVSRMVMMFDEYTIIFAEGSVIGVGVKPRILKGYGFEPFFLPENSEKTFAEMGAAEKNKYSHRGKALEDLKSKLKSKGFC